MLRRDHVRDAAGRRSPATLTRRRLLRGAFWAVAVGSGASGVMALVRYLWPQAHLSVTSVQVPADQLPRPGGDPLLAGDGQFWLVSLAPGEGLPQPTPPFTTPALPVPPRTEPARAGGLVALVNRGTEAVRDCRLVWRPLVEEFGLREAFRNPCSGSVFTKAGIPVVGPAQRPLDTVAVQVQRDGSVVVDTAKRQAGGPDNAQRLDRP